MKNLYCLTLTVFIFNCLSAQVTIEAKNLPHHGSGTQLINKKNNLPVGNHSWDETESFVNGFAKVASDHKWGFVNSSGVNVIKPVYEAARNFVNQLAAARQNGKWGFINEKGVTVIPFQYEIVFDFKENITAAYKKGKWSLIGRSGNLIKQLDVDIFWGFSNGIARITKDNRNGTMNLKGEIISLEPPKAALKNPFKLTNTRLNNQQDGTCPTNIDFEYGNLYNWYCYTGQVTEVNYNNVITVGPSAPTINRHTIVPAVTPSAIDPYGFFPTNPPDGSGYAVKLGNDINGHQAERITYQVNVPANSSDASITYRYAVVFQDPGHDPWQQPRFSAKLKDVQTNTYLPCASYEYVATSTLPGFMTSPIDDTIKYKTWSSVYVNLSKYAGKSLILEFTTADCTPGAHWGYAYVDVGDCNIAANVEYSCNPNQAIFTAPPGFQYYKWWSNNFSTLLGTGETLTLLSPPAPGTTIQVEVIPYNGFGCSDTLAVPYTASFPVANAGPDRSFCPGSFASLGTTAVQGFNYKWSPSTYLSDSTAANPNASPPVSTTYHVTVTSDIPGCVAEDSVVVIVQPKPVAAFTAPPAQCLNGNSFNFTNGSTINPGSLSYHWSFGDGSTSTQANPTHSYTNAGTYSVKLVATGNNGCRDSLVNPAVTVHSNPQVRTINDVSICRGNTVLLQGMGAQTYSWSPALNLNCTDCTNPIASPPASTRYIVRGVDQFGCYAFDTVNITVHQPIGIEVSPDRTICQNESIPLQATGDATSYIWSPAVGLSNSSTANTIASPVSTTQYRVIGYDGNNCFSDTGYVTITVNPSPAITLGPDATLSTGTVYPLTSTVQNGPIVSWQWTPATDLSCADCPLPNATVKEDIRYIVRVSNSFGCTSTDSINLRTFCEGSQVFIPNAFTPDGDGKNDILMVRAKGIELVKSFRIFTRWGELIYEKTNFAPNDPAFGWDGKIRGTKGAPEVYVYTAEVICTNLQTYLFKGNTTILK